MAQTESVKARRLARAQQEREKMDALIERDFPTHWLEPWRLRLETAGLAWPWAADMRPLSVSGDEPVFTLTARSDQPVEMRLVLSGDDQELLLTTARTIEEGWPL